MTKEQFIQRFALSNLPSAPKRPIFGQSLTPAAVLIPLCQYNDQLHILLTQRAKHLRHHGGQISFPGGKVDQQDSDIIATALREVDEEIGISPTHIEIIGQGHHLQTYTGYQVTPIIGFINSDINITIDDNEVASVFFVPLAHVLNKNNYFAVSTCYAKQNHQVQFLPYKQHNIWGATAAMLYDLAQCFN